LVLVGSRSTSFFLSLRGLGFGTAIGDLSLLRLRVRKKVLLCPVSRLRCLCEDERDVDFLQGLSFVRPVACGRGSGVSLTAHFKHGGGGESGSSDSLSYVSSCGVGEILWILYFE